MYRKLHLLALALAVAAVAAPIAQANTDGTLLSRASQAFELQQVAKINPGRGTDGALLSEAAGFVRSNAGQTGPRVDPLAVSYLQLKTGEGFSFKAPSYWSTAQRTAAPITARVGVNRSLGVPPQYLGTPKTKVSTASSSHRPKVDPLAVSYLRGHGFSPGQIKALTVGVDPLAQSYLREQGLSPNQVKAWTVGACSYQEKPASCYASPERTAVPSKVDPLAVSYLQGMGLSASEIKAWTQGACSHEVKPAACYASFERTAAPVQAVGSGGFDWADAGIGAGATLGLVLLLAGLGAGLVISRQNRRRQVVSA